MEEEDLLEYDEEGGESFFENLKRKAQNGENDDEGSSLNSKEKLRFMEDIIKEDELKREEIQNVLNSHKKMDNNPPQIDSDAKTESATTIYRQIKTDLCFQKWIGWIIDTFETAIETAEKISDALSSSTYGLASSIIYIVSFITLLAILLAIYFTLLVVCAIGYLICTLLN